MCNKYYPPIALIFLILISGCSGQSSGHDDISGLRIYTDGATGCEYVFKKLGDSGGMTARIASDGQTHSGCGK